jgi:hypothetical protein
VQRTDDICRIKDTGGKQGAAHRNIKLLILDFGALHLQNIIQYQFYKYLGALHLCC